MVTHPAHRHLFSLSCLVLSSTNSSSGTAYPRSLDTMAAIAATIPKTTQTPAKRALYNNPGRDEALALALDKAIRGTKKDDWRGNRIKEKEVRIAIRRHLGDDGLVDQVFQRASKDHGQSHRWFQATGCLMDLRENITVLNFEAHKYF